jgi:hypothetical protein
MWEPIDSNGKWNLFGWIDELARWLPRSLFGRRVGIVRRIIAWAIVLAIIYGIAQLQKG